ncbi:MAG: hypothetical protein E7012_00125 [Alphaproteobacteria bacterium]|nr:hypothetical protein [Alphaproteobacteria bacterium]
MADAIEQKYNAIYADGNFEKIKLGALINRGGASGKIYQINEHPNLVAKIFHTTKNSHNNRKKLEAMLLNKPNFPPVENDGVMYTQIAWPEALLEDEQGFCVGYLMPLINMDDAVSLDHLMQKAIRKKLNLPEKYAYRIFAAYNVTSMITSLHKCGHYVVDLKPSNVSVYKNNMMVAMVDCDGFSIKGEKDRFPAEFVSEEYIYPEGMNLSCQEMGEEQDKFALAVIIFRLLNNGVHPFSGIPKKNDEKMLTIQNRIEGYHYAYGLWPDIYQAPHPYSIHEYFDQTTLGMFERAFVKGGKRPSAYEWQEHLWNLMHNLRQCKNNPNHVYFTSKGCGLCMSEDKFYHEINSIKKQKQSPKKIRGIEIDNLANEKISINKAIKKAFESKMQKISYAIICAYMLFFGFLYKILYPLKEYLENIGIGAQLVIATFMLFGVHELIDKYQNIFPPLKNKSITDMLQVYALICVIIALVSVNNIPNNLLELAL